MSDIVDMRLVQKLLGNPKTQVPQNMVERMADEITRLRAEIDALKASIADEREDAARAMQEACLCPATWRATWPKEEIRNINPASFRERQP